MLAGTGRRYPARAETLGTAWGSDGGRRSCGAGFAGIGLQDALALARIRNIIIDNNVATHLYRGIIKAIFI